MEECWGDGVLHLCLQIHFLCNSQIQMLPECHPLRTMVSLKRVHMSWIFLQIATKEIYNNTDQKIYINCGFASATNCNNIILSLFVFCDFLFQHKLVAHYPNSAV